MFTFYALTNTWLTRHCWNTADILPSLTFLIGTGMIDLHRHCIYWLHHHFFGFFPSLLEDLIKPCDSLFLLPIFSLVCCLFNFLKVCLLDNYILLTFICFTCGLASAQLLCPIISTLLVCLCFSLSSGCCLLSCFLVFWTCFGFCPFVRFLLASDWYFSIELFSLYLWVC